MSKMSLKILCHEGYGRRWPCQISSRRPPDIFLCLSFNIFELISLSLYPRTHKVWIPANGVSVASSGKFEPYFMCHSILGILESKGLSFTHEVLGCLIKSKNSPFLCEVISTVASRSKHGLTFDFLSPNAFLLFLDIMRPAIFISHVSDMLKKPILYFRNRISQYIRWLSLHSSILITLNLLAFSRLFFFNMQIRSIGSKLIMVYNVLDLLAGLKSFSCSTDFPRTFRQCQSSILNGSLYGSFWQMLSGQLIKALFPMPVLLLPASMFRGLVLGFPSFPLCAGVDAGVPLFE